MLFPWKCLVSRVFQSSWQTPVPNFQAMVDSQKTIENPYMLSPVLQPWCNNDWNRRGNMGYHKYDQVGYTSHNFVGIKKDKSLRFAPLICQVNPKSQEFNSNLLNPQIERASKAQCFHIKMSGIYGWSTKKTGIWQLDIVLICLYMFVILVICQHPLWKSPTWYIPGEESWESESDSDAQVNSLSENSLPHGK